MVAILSFRWRFFPNSRSLIRENVYFKHLKVWDKLRPCHFKCLWSSWDKISKWINFEFFKMIALMQYTFWLSIIIVIIIITTEWLVLGVNNEALLFCLYKSSSKNESQLIWLLLQGDEKQEMESQKLYRQYKWVLFLPNPA